MCILNYLKQWKICKVKEEKEKFYLFEIFFCKLKINFEEKMMQVIVLDQ